LSLSTFAPANSTGSTHSRSALVNSYDRPTPIAPYCSSTYASIAGTCGDCAFKEAGCYPRAGAAKKLSLALDAAAEGKTPEAIIHEEVALIDRAFGGGQIPQDGARGGRDLRLHVGGDAGNTAGACLLAGAAARWRGRGGGSVWTFTHLWRRIDRSAWGTIAVLASVELPEDIDRARAVGYPAAIVVDGFPTDKAFRLPGTGARIIPCPGQTRSVPCVLCRLCLDRDLLDLNVAIAFEVHGSGARATRDALLRLRLHRFDGGLNAAGEAMGAPS
jgi:hypothetical protein